MTKEEIIEAISEDKTMPFIQQDQLANIVDFVLKNYMLYLPSNLNEAADSFAQGHFRREYFQVPRDGMRAAFRAGAKWMAGQGASYNTEVGWLDGPTVLDWPVDILDEFEMGDKVVVQIRKK